MRTVPRRSNSLRYPSPLMAKFSGLWTRLSFQARRLPMGRLFRLPSPRQRHRVRHPCRVPAPDVRALPPAGRLRQSPPRRPRIGLVAGSSAGRAARRHGRGREHVGIGTTITVAFPSHDPIAMTTSPEATIQVDTSALAGLRRVARGGQRRRVEILSAALQQMGMSVEEARSHTKRSWRSTPQRRRE